MRLGIPRWEFFGWLDKRLGNGALGVFWADKRLGNGALGVFWADKRLGNGGFWECFGLGNGLGRGSEVFCVSFLVFGGLGMSASQPILEMGAFGPKNVLERDSGSSLRPVPRIVFFTPSIGGLASLQGSHMESPDSQNPIRPPKFQR
jgi:hypothetical protein